MFFAISCAFDQKGAYGKGKHKTQPQRDIEILREYIDKKAEYYSHLGKFGNRNSFSKTDTDATFMHMKEDHMRNGQLKPGYNIQIGVESEYIVGVGSFSNRTDVNTLLPFLNRMRKHKNHREWLYNNNEILQQRQVRKMSSSR